MLVCASTGLRDRISQNIGLVCIMQYEATEGITIYRSSMIISLKL